MLASRTSKPQSVWIFLLAVRVHGQSTISRSHCVDNFSTPEAWSWPPLAPLVKKVINALQFVSNIPFPWHHSAARSCQGQGGCDGQ